MQRGGLRSLQGTPGPGTEVQRGVRRRTCGGIGVHEASNECRVHQTGKQLKGRLGFVYARGWLPGIFATAVNQCDSPLGSLAHGVHVGGSFADKE